jgi:FlaA1/EpsC-like NDP-sugar epimerase
MNISARLLTSARYRRLTLFCVHLLVFLFSYFISCCIFNNMKLSADWITTLFLPPLAVILFIKLVVFGLFRQFSTLWKYVNTTDLVSICTASFFSAILIIGIWIVMMYMIPAADRAMFEQVPESIILLDMIISIISLCGLRIATQMSVERSAASKVSDGDRINLLIAGAGDAGEMLSREVEKLFLHRYRIVGFVDDNPDKLGTFINGYEVLGSCDKIAQIKDAFDIEELVIAIPSASQKVRRRIIKLAEEAHIRSRIIPTLAEITSGEAGVSQMREINIADLLSRDEINLDMQLIHSFINNKAVLVTGAGGSIGSELCRQIANLGPRQIILLEQAENPLFHIERELDLTTTDIDIVPVIADVCDRKRMEQVFAEFKPEVVFHAAAHKHVPLMEQNPGESVKNNVFGTACVADAADKFGATHFVMVSSDKAVNPSSMMGCTKRIAELYIQQLNSRSKTDFITVRFGNVLGSSCSVVPVFQEQIDSGGPITVTHKDMTRYFMTIPEATMLVLQAATMGHGGEIFLLDMGEPVKILDLAMDMIRLNGLEPGVDIKIEFTGIRPGEKLYEELNIAGEDMQPTSHPQVAIWKTATVDSGAINAAFDALHEAVDSGSRANVFEAVRQIVPEFTGGKGLK